MDGLIPYPEARTVQPAPRPQPAPGMPPESPVEMPEQRLKDFDPASRRTFVDPVKSRSRLWPRLVVLGGAAVITAIATFEMGTSLTLGGLTVLKALVLLLFAINTGWIAVTFVSATAGAILVDRRRGRTPIRPGPIRGRTAVLMPTYNEDAERVFASLEAMAAGVQALDPRAPFDWFVLSDTTNPAVALAEESAVVELRARLGEGVPLYYRRRRRNIARKAGNIADFCRRWGGAYNYLIVLDADSLMEPAVMLELARRMEADPDAGLIQTVPRLVHGKSLLARLHQFAGRVYGPVIASGLAWWSGREGNYWGHNAIIRREAFTGAAGLPLLSGKPPFGGHILSHDFVEAALIRRAGWTVIIADDLQGSYEETPPSIIDFAVRDRRWCQGNLQHARIVPAKGLHWVSRFHLVTGIFSYAASLLWLLLIVCGLLLAVQVRATTLDYFQNPYQPFPTWPQIDPQLELQLLAFTAVLLLGPKAMGLLSVLRDPVVRQQSGGGLKLFASFLFEVIVSALIAPIMMMIQSGIVFSVLLGRDSGWKPQRRDDGGFTLAELWRRHRWHMAGGLVLAIAAYFVSPAMLAILSPAVAGLLLAVPISAITASTRIGRAARRFGLLQTPEEIARPEIGRAAMRRRLAHREIVAATPDIRGLVRDDWRRRHHLALVDAGKDRRRGEIDPIEAIAAAKLGEARTLDEALAYLGPDEQAVALATPALFERLSLLSQVATRPAA
jgi:membrane glycosyltransferase